MVERQVIGVFGHRQMGQGALGWQPTLDQPVRCGGLADARIAAAAGLFGADRYDVLETGRDNIQPLGAICRLLGHGHRKPGNGQTMPASS